jgi:hypothetical protein
MSEIEIDRDTPEGIKTRISLAKFVIQALSESDDPRRDDALAHYKAQLDTLEKRLAEATKPPPIVIGLKTATLSARSQKE